MNNSFERLIDGMVEALRKEVIPHLDDEFARGQAFGVIFMLRSIALRGGWSSAYLDPGSSALRELAARLKQLGTRPGADAELAAFAARIGAADPGGPSDGEVCRLIDWLPGASLVGTDRADVVAAINLYIHRQLKHEIATSARPMFAEISLGKEETPC